MEAPIDRCLFCYGKPEIKAIWELDSWTNDCAESVHKLLDLEIFPASLFLSAKYCAPCKALVRDVDFTSRKIVVLERRLTDCRKRIAQYLLDRLQKLVSCNEKCDPEEIENFHRRETDEKQERETLVAQTHMVSNVDFADTLPGCMNAEPTKNTTKGEQIQADVDTQKKMTSRKTNRRRGFLCKITKSAKTKRRKSVKQHPNSINTLVSHDSACRKSSRMKRRSTRLHPPSTFVKNSESENESDHDMENENWCLSAVCSENETSSTKSSAFATDNESPNKEYIGNNSSGERIKKRRRSSRQKVKDQDDSMISSAVSRMILEVKSVRDAGAECSKNLEDKEGAYVSSRLDPEAPDHYRSYFRKEFDKWQQKHGTEGGTWESILNLSEKTQLPEDPFIATFNFLCDLEAEKEEANFAYVCREEECGRRFIDVTKLQNHMVNHHRKYFEPAQFQCPICTFKLASGFKLDVHINKKHFGHPRPMFCPVPHCDLRYTDLQILKAHMLRRHPNIPYDDEDCEVYGYRDKTVSLVPNKGRKTEDAKPILYCPEKNCSYRSLNPNYMDSHRAKFHFQQASGTGTSTACSDNAVSNPIPKPFGCNCCDRRFSNLQSYMAHNRTVHKNERAICSYCGKTFTGGPHTLSDHIRWNHRDVAPEFRCKICTRLYFTPEECEAHERKHTTGPNFRCVLHPCDQSNHDSLEELIKHVQSCHGDEPKKTVCEICGKIFQGRGNQSLTKHMVVHTNEKKFKCKFCGKKYKGSTQVRTHVDLQHQDQVKSEYKCTKCDEVFKVYQYWYKHCRNKHGSFPLPSFKAKKKN